LLCTFSAISPELLTPLGPPTLWFERFACGTFGQRFDPRFFKLVFILKAVQWGTGLRVIKLSLLYVRVIKLSLLYVRVIKLSLLYGLLNWEKV